LPQSFANLSHAIEEDAQGFKKAGIMNKVSCLNMSPCGWRRHRL